MHLEFPHGTIVNSFMSHVVSTNHCRRFLFEGVGVSLRLKIFVNKYWDPRRGTAHLGRNIVPQRYAESA